VSQLRFGAYELDLRSGEVRKAGALLNLPPQPFKILVLLATRPGQLVTREEIQQQIWGSETFVDFEQGLNFAINKIRVTLGDDAEAPRYIETLPRRGYRFIASVEQIGIRLGATEGLSSEDYSVPKNTNPATQARPEDIPSGGRFEVNNSLRRLLALALVVALAAASVWAWQKWRTQVSAFHSQPQITSLAVLPLENLSGDPSQEYFADGMTDELITDLASIASLRVISRTSTTHYKGTRKTVPEIARELNVDAVVEGSVGLSANKVRIRAQLVRAVPEEHLWAESYERDLPDVLALQRDVAKAIAGEIKIKLTPGEKARLAQARQIDPEAYHSYLRGRFSFENWTPDAVNLARKSFREAIAKDPNYALAYAGLADTYVFGEVDLDPKVSIPLARAAAMKALELDDTLSDAHAALAQVKFLGEWDWTGAETEFRRAINLNPGDTLVHHMYSHFLLNTGRNEESLKESELYLLLDPLSVAANNHLGYHYLATGQYDLAIEQEHKALQIDPSYHQAIYFLGDAYRHSGMPQEALVQYEKAMTLSGTNPDWVRSLRKAYQAEGWRGYFRKSLDRDLERSNREYVSPYGIAENYALLGDKAQAFRYLDKAYADRDAFLVWIKAERDFDTLHSDPRYADLLRRMGLPP
jgi:TolB-like protein/DNA-binding winged helix-turn-helix (wHTH) protein/Tfp pilus assembly protein PilF